MFAIGSTRDPFDAFDYSTASTNTAGRIPRPSRIDPGERTFIIVGVGQSMIAASESVTYTPVHGDKVDNFNVYDGGTYKAQDPLLGCGVFYAGGCWLSRHADKLIDADMGDRVILAPIARGSTTVQDWMPGGFMNPNLLAVSRRLAALGLAPSAYYWAQGEANRGAISRSAYRANLSAVIQSARLAGSSAPWLLGKSTYASGSADTVIRAAIDDLVDGSTIFAGADHDSIGEFGRVDGVHFNGIGADLAAGLWRDALFASPVRPF